MKAQRTIVKPREAAARLRLQTAALEAAANGIVITDRNGVIEWANPAFTRMTGYSFQEAAGETPRLLKSGLLGAAAYQQLWQTILAGQVWQGELINRRKDGSLYIEEQTIAPVVDDAGQITHFVAVKQDITARKQAETRIRQDATRAEILAEVSRALTEAGPDFAAVVEVTARTLAGLMGDLCALHLPAEGGASLALAAGFQAPPQAGASPGGPLDPACLKKIEVFAVQAFRSGQAVRAPSVAQAGAAETMGLAVLAAPLCFHGQTTGVLSLARCGVSEAYTAEDEALLQNLADRTALAIANARLYQDLARALDKEKTVRAQLVQSEKFAAVGRMVASVAHELNNPLQTIRNCLYLIEQDTPPGASLEFVQLAASEVQRLTSLVAELREVYRPRANRVDEVCDLARLLEEVHQLAAPYLQRQHVAWEMRLSGGPCTVRGASDQLKQVFLNISLNAIEAMQPAGGTLTVRLEAPPDGKQVGIAFTDTGPGILDEDLPRLFEPLFTTKETGLGLGLSISYDVVQKHGGEIAVESLPGQGATFTVWLPASDGQDQKG